MFLIQSPPISWLFLGELTHLEAANLAFTGIVVCLFWGLGSISHPLLGWTYQKPYPHYRKVVFSTRKLGSWISKIIVDESFTSLPSGNFLCPKPHHFIGNAGFLKGGTQRPKTPPMPMKFHAHLGHRIESDVLFTPIHDIPNNYQGNIHTYMNTYKTYVSHSNGHIGKILYRHPHLFGPLT